MSKSSDKYKDIRIRLLNVAANARALANSEAPWALEIQSTIDDIKVQLEEILKTSRTLPR